MIWGGGKGDFTHLLGEKRNDPLGKRSLALALGGLRPFGKRGVRGASMRTSRRKRTSN